MAKINDSSAKLLKNHQARAWRTGSLWAEDFFSMSGDLGYLNAIRQMDSIADSDLRERAMQATIFYYGHKNQKDKATQMIAGLFLMKASLKMSHEYFSALHYRMAWSKSQPQLSETLTIRESETWKESKSDIDPIRSKDHQDHHQKPIEVLLHCIAPANAPSTNSGNRCAGVESISK
jgi:hypothetical protein